MNHMMVRSTYCNPIETDPCVDGMSAAILLTYVWYCLLQYSCNNPDILAMKVYIRNYTFIANKLCAHLHAVSQLHALAPTSRHGFHQEGKPNGTCFLKQPVSERNDK